MQISKEFLMEAFGLSLLVLLILMSARMFERATDLTAQIERRQEEKIAELEEYEIIRYDGLKIDGMTATGYIKTAVGEYQLPVTVTTGNGSFTVTKKEDYAEFRNVDSEYYINPLVLFQCNVIRDENGSLSAISLCIE